MHEFQKLDQLVDVRGSVMRNGSFRMRPWSSITDIGEHHSGTEDGNAFSFAVYHVTRNKWPGPGYHFVILKDGTIQWCNSINRVSYNIGNHNSKLIGVCIVGNGNFTPQQEESRLALKRALINTEGLNLSHSRNFGHNEYSGHSWNACPGINMNLVRSHLRENRVIGGGSFSERTLRVQSPMLNGNDVKKIQQQLKDHGFDPGKIDGWYGTKVESAVKEFQRSLNLTVDGVVGPETRSRLSKSTPNLDDNELETGYTRMLRLENPMMTGSDVRSLQEFLNNKGFSVGEPDGKFGSRTELGVIEFQETYGLVSDGIAGPKTFAKVESLMSVVKYEEATHGFPRTLKIESPLLEGSDIKKAQMLLSDYGLDGKWQEGFYDEETKRQIQNFQRHRGLKVDGVAGTETFQALIAPEEVEVIVSQMNIRNRPDFTSESVDRKVKRGERFEVKTRIDVEDTEVDFYLLKNGLYLSTHRNYVRPYLPNTQSFQDIEGHWGEDAISLMLERGIVNGYQDGTFRPNNPLTRGELAIILRRYFKTPDGKASGLSDLQGHTSEEAVDSLVEAGIISGFEDGTFRPDHEASREQVAALLNRYLRKKPMGQSAFKDVSKDHWSYDHIVALSDNGIFKGTTAGNFEPSEPITRAQMMVVLQRMH